MKLAKQEVSIPKTCILENKEHQKNVRNEIEKIVDHKKIGRGFKYLIKWKNFPSIENEWKKATNIKEKNLINEYHNNMLNRPKRGRKKKILINNLLLSLIFFFSFFVILNGQIINDKFYFCEHNDNNRLADLNNNCKQAHLLDKTFSFDENFNIWILSKQSYVINDFGHQCFKKKLICYMNTSFFLENQITSKKKLFKSFELNALQWLSQNFVKIKK